MRGITLLLFLVLFQVAVTPAWPYSRTWGYAPSATVALGVILVMVLVVTGAV
jgi:hypothetical protein